MNRTLATVILIVTATAILYLALFRDAETIAPSGNPTVASLQGEPSADAGAKVVERPAAEQGKSPAESIGSFETLLRGVQSNDPDSLKKFADVLEHCYPYLQGAGDTPVLTKGMSATAVEEREIALSRYRKRCAPLADAKVGGDRAAFIRGASEQGNLSAKARLMVRSQQNPTGAEFDQVLTEIIAVRDFDALFELAPMFATMPPEDITLPSSDTGIQLSGTPAAFHAWQLLACRNGASACRYGSYYLDDLCVFSGYCGYANYEDLMFNEFFPAAQRNQIQEEAANLARRLGL